MAMFALLAALGLMGLVLRARSPWTYVAGAALNLVFAGFLTAYVLRTEPAFGGRNAWHLRSDTGAHTLYFAAMGVAGLAVAGFVLLALRGSRGRTLRGAAAASGGLDLVLGWFVFIGFEID